MINKLEHLDITFTEDFLWDTTTADAQVEGNNYSFYDDEDTALKWISL